MDVVEEEDGEAMKCNKCKSEIEKEDIYCSTCGIKVLKNTALKVVLCPNTIAIEDGFRTPKPCGKEIKEGKKYCSGCGWKINQSCFQPGAKMCSGEQNGAPCNNIIFPYTEFCSQCEKHPCYTQENPVNSGDFNRKSNDPHKTTDKTKYGDVQVDEPVESTCAKTSNKELVKKRTNESEVEDQNQTPINVDYHTAKPCSNQPENVVHMNVPSPSESVLTPLHETNELHRPDRAKSKFEQSTKVQADEKSQDIWTPPNQSQKSGVSSMDESHADEEITKVQQPSEEGSESGSSVNRQQNQEYQADAKKGKTSTSVVAKGPHRMTTRSKSDCVEICFCAIASKKFVENPSSQVYLRFALEEMGGFGTLYAAYHKNTLSDGKIEVSFQGTFQKQSIQAVGLSYCYCVGFNNESSNITNEYVYDAYNVDENNLRTFQKKDIPDMWVQYDGVLNPLPEESTIQKFKSFFYNYYERKMEKNISTAAKYFFPKWRHFSVNGSESTSVDVIKNVDMLCEGLMNVMLCCKKWKWGGEENCRAFLGKVWIENLKPKLNDLDTQPDLIAAVGIILLWDKYNLPLDENNKNALFRSLILEGNDKEKNCPMYDKFKESFQGLIPNIKKALQQFIMNEQSSGNPTWLCSLPLYHFLHGKLRPYEEMNKRTDHYAEKPLWWGKDDFERQMNLLKGRTKWSIDAKTFLKILAPMFEIDFYLPRAFMSVLKFEKLTLVETKLFPPEVGMAGLYYFFCTEKFYSNKNKIATDCLKTIADQMRRSCKSSKNVSQDQLTRGYLCVKIGVDLLEQVPSFYETNDRSVLMLRTIEVFVVALAVYDQLLKKWSTAESKVEENVHLFALRNKKKLIEDWLNQFTFYPSVENDLKIWDILLSMDIPESSIKDALMDELKDTLQKKLNKKNTDIKEELISLYCNGDDRLFQPTIQEILGNIAFEALEKGCVCEERVLSGRGTKNYGSMLSRLFERSWEKNHLSDSNVRDIINFTLSWKPFVQFLKMFYGKENHEVLTTKCQVQLMQATSILHDTLNKLWTGQIEIGDVLLIDTHKKTFYDLNCIIWKCDKKSDLEKELVFQTIQLRCKEVKMVKDMCDNIQELVLLCQHFTDHLAEIDEKMESLANMDSFKICAVCKPGNLEKISDVNAYEPIVTIFKLSPDDVGVLKKLKKLSEGLLFLNLWIKQGQKEVAMKQGPLTINEVIENVWQKVYKHWTSLVREIAFGDITFKEFQQHFKNIPNDKLEEQLLHLSMTSSNHWIKERLRQFNQYRILEQCVYGANVILKVVQEYKLEGDFQPIKMIEKMVKGTDTKMNEFDSSLINACDVLMGIKDEHAKCLEEFINCKNLIDWLLESIESPKELNVFVDLASISAGEGDMEVAKVKCLHAATTGYAPLIFNLGNMCDYRKFLEKCKLVWKELKTDPGLPIKLKVTSQHLNWLKSVKSALGSVEVTSMSQAQAITNIGIYMVGKIEADVDKEKLTLDDVLQLHVQKNEEGSRLSRRYQYMELQELQSKLMLVAGKADMGKDDVDRFTIVFDAIVRLCNVYIKLVSSGCVLFTNWQARFLCDPARKVCAFVKFGSGDGCTQLKGRTNDGDNISTIIPKVANFMEKCLEEWLKYIDHKRDVYQHLNFFTIDQMVILQKELVLMGGEIEPSDDIYPLLSIVKHDCTKMDLICALKNAKADVLHKKAEIVITMEDREGEEDVNRDEEGFIKTTAVETFIEEITKSGYSEILARAALRKGISPENIDEGLVWCMEHEVPALVDLTTEVDKDQLEVKVEEFEGWTKSGMSISTITQNILSGLQPTKEDTLIPDLEQLWKEFLSSISSSVSDYLSVEHLGIILRRLAETETFTPNRPLIPGFERGVPNLLLCPQDEILNTVLTIYSHDPDQPLPQSDEILMCTPHTTLDEVEIFWRRALFDTTERIHCLVSGDLLDYDVSDRGERRLDYHLQKATENDIPYKLVVVCSTERENHSRIVAALDKYRRPPIQLLSHKKTAEYIKKKLTFNLKEPRVRPSAEADSENCTVRVVKSWRAGVGKTLHKKRLAEKLESLHSGVVRTNKAVVSIPLNERKINIDSIMSVLLQNTLYPGKIEPRLFHIDLSHEVQEGVDNLLFHLLILGCLTNSTGHVWRKLPYDLYIVETMPLLARDFQFQRGYIKCMHRCLDLLPDVTCRSPLESVMRYQGNAQDIGENDLLFDPEEFRSSMFQRPFQYLYRLDMNRGIGDVNIRVTEGNLLTCLQTLLKHCGIRDPSWAELRHFVWFLNTQLVDFENSAFLRPAAAEDLPGFSQFVLRFLIQMSRDFATRSLKISEQSPMEMLKRMDSVNEETDEAFLRQFQLRRTWESSPHPYLFFNMDGETMTFMGFNIDRQTGNLVDAQTGTVLERGIMQKNLQDALKRNKVPINENFDSLPREEKLSKLCSVMGVDVPHDPDPNYELTTDNVKKIMAIYMRFRCDIPVIIMGETGCGKTRLVKFMCQLQCPIGVEVQNMVLMKIHGGTCKSDIIRKVRKAERIAQENTANYGQKLYTVLFFDEANTTEAIGLIKEIMCDHAMEGEPLKLCHSLKIVAACNPYKKHSKDLIKRFERAGLGYHVDADKTTDRMGRVPMRRLVYRVQPLPQSMLPLVWDFGQLDTKVEEMYIKQMVLRYIQVGKLPNEPNLDTAISHILTSAQEFMRNQADECSFVSLRDVERVLEVMSWFYKQTQGETYLFKLMKANEEAVFQEKIKDIKKMTVEEKSLKPVNDVTKSLVLALGVCYQACLKNRKEFRDKIVREFRPPCLLPNGPHQMADIITRCQNVFLENSNLETNIAKNQALRDNVFMMVVCIELRIPLFLVGKPGSSKSLAKTIVADAMQGSSAHTELYMSYKECSPLSVPEGIVKTFSQCAMFQKDKNLNRYVSVVVLDEVGLAEDSPKMPLKTLHPLLEDGCLDDETPEEHKKVAFIGISNWALDPAKMNRGILVQTEVPDLEELIESANDVCSRDKDIKRIISPLFKPLAVSYLEVCKIGFTRREFFGLRDFYSLIKMVYSFAKKNRKKPTWLMLQHCIKRNFGGLEHSGGEDPLAVFFQNLTRVSKISTPSRDDPDCSPTGLIEACLKGDELDSDTRYLLLLTENYGALTVLQQKILTMKNAITIFGSSFPSDQEYTQVCRNINRIKVCMETGNTVVLLNLEHLYESLYDTLNQYYVHLGPDRFVDLGLGNHRFKCMVHREFRLIVIAEKEIVYSKFPIPLINRLEKHFLNISTMLSEVQVQLAQNLNKWAEQFIKIPTITFRREKKVDYTVGEVFIGYHADTCASIILLVSQKYTDGNLQGLEAEMLKTAKEVLLWCATPDGVFRSVYNLSTDEFKFVENTYYQQQKHDNLLYYLDQKIRAEYSENLFAQVTTHSKLITTVDVSELSQYLHIPRPQITLLTLQSFDTEQQFCRQVKQSFERELEEESLLIVQCDSGNENVSLVACAQHCVLDQLQQVADKKIGKTYIVFIIHIPRLAGGGFTGFQCGLWHSVHIDDLRPDSDKMPSFMEMKNKSVGTLLENATGRAGGGDTEDMDLEGRGDSQPIPKSEEGGIMDCQNVYPHDFGDMTKHTEQVHVERKVDIALFIKLTARHALAMLKDTEDSNRTTKRVNMLLELLQQESKGGKLTFVRGIGRHLAVLMKEKEETMGHSAESWLYAEATKRDCINRAGTFRKARNQCLIEKLSPILAGIIAQVDTNSNLDLLIQSDPSSWEHLLWLEIINNPSATQIEYSMVVSPKEQEELPEVMVKGTGCDGLKFNALMPFSWLIYRLIDQILRTSQNVDTCETIDERVMRVSNIIEKATLGKVLQKCLFEVKVMNCVKAYLSDFVHMVCHVTSQEEHVLICQNLLNGINMEFRGGLPSVVMNFVAIHAVYSKSEPRLKNFASITRVWPDCSEKIIEFQQKSSQFYIITDQEMTLDVLGLYLLLKTLEPNKDSLTDQKSRQLWQKLVHKYRRVVERILEQFVTEGHEGHEEGIKKFGRRCIEGIKEARCMWTKVVVMKLFLQHVCSDEVMPVERLMPLWVMLKDSVDFKNIESLEKVEKFLKMCMKSSVTKAFGRQERCKACESEVIERPILLSCKDLICVKCYNDLTILQTRVCPVCHNEIPEHFNPHQDNTADIKIRKLNNFKNRCNSFFMDLVSQLCFSDDEPPSNEVVQKLMSYITATARRGQGGRMASKEMSVFEEGIDPTPVLRSFLLQHLLRTSSMQVKQDLQMYLQQAEDLMSLKENEEKMVDLCLLVIQCLEDSFHHEVANSTEPMKSKIKMATQMLHNDAGYVVREALDVDKLCCMAQTRFGLTVVAEVLHKLLVEKSIKHNQQIRKLLEAAGRLCDECGSRQPKLFLIKHLCRCFGVETYQKICKTTDATIVRWLSVPELQKNKIVECSDRFIVCGDQYKELREKLTQAALGQNMDIFNAAIQAVQLPDYQKRTLVLLAVMREITMCYLYPEKRRRVTPAAVEQLQQFLSQHPLFSNQTDLPAAVCRNAVWRRNPQLTVQEGMDLGHQSTVCLLNHFFITLLEIPEERTLVEPLNRLVQQPGDMQNSFLPTMPQDDVAEIKEALLAARQAGDENPVFYRCPNGHPYVIGNCGRPATVGRCKDCGLEIGGQSYQLRAGNIVDQGLDQTATGHVLGRAEGRQPDASPERGLSPIECAIVRLFTHMAMYLGASINQQAIQSLIKPDLDADKVLLFLWAHIEKDLLTIQRAVGRSVDDVYILIHSICRDMMRKHRGSQLNQEMCLLANKAARKKWEEDFAKTYLSPGLQEMARDLKNMNKKLANDQRLGSDPMLCLLFEIDVPSDHSSPSSLHNVAAVWRYRSQITMDHLLHTVQVQAPTHKVLLMFLQEEKQLRAIRLVPSIMKLQKLLIQRFQRKLDRGEALTMTIEDMIKEYENEGRLDEMRNLVNDFILAWQCVRDKLLAYTFPTLEGLTKIPKEFCQKPITDAQPVSVLLPTFRDNGLCAYGLLYYLLKKQNNFLQEYCKVKKLKYTDLPKVQLRDVTPAHLISYHPDRDILPMVMANCHYTFQVGKGTKIDYNFGDLERQLMDRFLFSKSVIEMPVYEFEMMTYRSETTNAVVFKDLRQKIKQEPLTPVVANQICEETRAYPDLCETLDKLEITISFLKSVKGDPSMSLEKFMTQTLKMENPFPSQKARSSCQCKHAQSLWITLAMEKTRRQASHKQDAFEGVVTELREELNAAQRDMITSLCDEISLERLDLLLEILFECIMLTITVPKGTDDDDVDMAKLPLRDTLLGYISAPQYDLDLNYPGWTNDVIERIPNEGAGFTPILNNQAVDTWLFLYALVTVKQSERRY